eukprot:symbB.v1.2.029486.t1/scaffold3229.1/size60639/4
MQFVPDEEVHLAALLSNLQNPGVDEFEEHFRKTFGKTKKSKNYIPFRKLFKTLHMKVKNPWCVVTRKSSTYGPVSSQLLNAERNGLRGSELTRWRLFFLAANVRHGFGEAWGSWAVLLALSYRVGSSIFFCRGCLVCLSEATGHHRSEAKMSDEKRGGELR